MTFLLRGWLPLCLCLAVARAERVEFRAPQAVAYELEAVTTAKAAVGPAWLTARPVGGGKTVRLGDRLVLRLADTNRLAALCAAHALIPAGAFDERTFLLAAKDAAASARAAAALARLPGVEAAVPVMRRQARKHFAHAPAPDDPLYPRQTYLEASATASGFLPDAPDLNVRGAWAFSRGAGITVAVVDDGMDLTHPDLAANATGPHHDFITGGAGGHSGTFLYHGTAVAGLVAARDGNGRGLSGAAPRARLASWVIFDAQDNLPDDAGMAAMFGFAADGPDAVAVQNHSWGNSDFDVLEMSLPEQLAISNVVKSGRGGLGAVLVRSAGNTREQDYSFRKGVGDANLDAYANDPLQIAVAAVRNDGRAASYSTPGACVLVAAMGGDFRDGSPGLATTDPAGTAGLNRTSSPDGDYSVGALGFTGTSGSAPLVAGVTALALSANPRLGWRDVRLLLALSARHLDFADPDLATNGAGFRVSHNVGFGVPEAGTAVRLARAWSNRPPAVARHYVEAVPQAIPDDGLRVRVTGEGVPPALASLPATGTLGLHPDAPTTALPLHDAGQATAPIIADLTGQGALMTRKPNTFAEKIGFAAAAGAAFAVIVNNEGTDERPTTSDTGFVAIPAVLLGKNDGEALRALAATNPAVRVSLGLDSATFPFAVTEGMTVEQVQVRVRWSHPRMADLRVTLRSPAGTISILHRPGASTSAVPGEWTYSSVHHLGEAATGTWTVAITDEATGMVGTVDSVELILHGVPITDTDADGLDDGWETARLSSLASGPRADPDGDGWNNAAEQLRGGDPKVNETPLRLDATEVSPGRVRLSWPALAGRTYEILHRDTPASGETLLRQIPGGFPEAGLLLPIDAAGRYFRVREAQ